MNFLLFVLLLPIIACQPTKKEESDVLSGGNSSNGGSTGSTTQGDFGIMFVTNQTFNGGAGVAAMDSACASEASSKNFTGTFKALVYDGAQRKPDGTGWVLAKLAEYRREDLTTVIGTTGTDKKFSFPLTNSITATAKFPWTGFSVDSSNWYFNGSTCGGWTLSTDGYGSNTSTFGNTSLTGFVSATDPWSNSYENSPFSYAVYSGTSVVDSTCDVSHPVICVQNYVKPLPSGAKKIFLSQNTVRGSLGITMMDNECASSATSLGLSGTYKAMVTTKNHAGVNHPQRHACLYTGNCTTTAENQNWVLAANTAYIRHNGTNYENGYIGTTNGGGIFTFPLYNSFTGNSSDRYWSGTGNAWIGEVGFPNGGTCGDWMEPSFNARLGNGGSTSVTAITDNESLCSAATTQKVLCVEQ